MVVFDPADHQMRNKVLDTSRTERAGKLVRGPRLKGADGLLAWIRAGGACIAFANTGESDARTWTEERRQKARLCNLTADETELSRPRRGRRPRPRQRAAQDWPMARWETLAWLVPLECPWKAGQEPLNGLPGTYGPSKRFTPEPGAEWLTPVLWEDGRLRFGQTLDPASFQGKRKAPPKANAKALQKPRGARGIPTLPALKIGEPHTLGTALRFNPAAGADVQELVTGPDGAAVAAAVRIGKGLVLLMPECRDGNAETVRRLLDVWGKVKGLMRPVAQISKGDEGKTGRRSKPEAGDTTARKGGRPKVKKTEADKRYRFESDWKRAKSTGTSLKDFCADRGCSMKDAEKKLNWCSQQRRRIGETS